MELRAGRVVERVRDSFREVEGVAQTRAGRLRMVAKDAFHLLSHRATIKAEDDLALMGEEIPSRMTKTTEDDGMSSDPGQPPNGGDQVRIDIDWSDEPMPVYSNGAQIVHTHREFSVAFTEFAPFAGRRPSPYPTRPGESSERARVVSSVRLPPDVFFQLMAAGASNWNKFVDSFGGPMAEKMPKFQLVGGEGVPPLEHAPGAPQSEE